MSQFFLVDFVQFSANVVASPGNVEKKRDIVTGCDYERVSESSYRMNTTTICFCDLIFVLNFNTFQPSPLVRCIAERLFPAPSSNCDWVRPSSACHKSSRTSFRKYRLIDLEIAMCTHRLGEMDGKIAPLAII